MELVNKNCYHALALREDEYAYCAPISDFSLCGKHPFTFSLQFMPKNTGGELVLFSQQDTVQIGWSKGAFYYQTGKAGKLSARQWSMPLAQGEWNQFDLSCDGKKLIFYLNGMSGYETAFTADEQVGEQDYHIGAALEGYIRYARIANVCMTQEQIKANQYQNSLASEKLELLFDFSGSVGKDMGRHQLPILLSGLGEVKSIVRALYPDKSGIAIPAASGTVNPGGFESGEYTLYHRVYLKRGRETDFVVAGNGNLSEGLVLEISSELHMKVVWNGREYLSQGTLPPDKWLDLAVTFDGKTLRTYVNGVLDTEAVVEAVPAALKQGNMQIGNILVNGRPLQEQSFHGYIDCVAVFDKALTAGKLTAFTEQAPYIYEQHLCALYAFHEITAAEVLSGGVLALSSGACLAIAENTLYVEEIGEVAYDLGTTGGEYTEFEIWEANTVVMAIAVYIEEQTGLKPAIDLAGGETLTGGLLDYVIGSVLTEPEVQKLLACISVMTAAQVLAVLVKLMQNGKLGVLLTTLYHTAAAYVMETVLSVSCAELCSEAGIFLAGLAVLCAAAACIVNDKQKDPPTPKPPTPKPDEKFHYLQIAAIQFCHSEAFCESAIPLAASSKVPVETPEWKSGVNVSGANPSIAAYIADQVQDVKIIVTFAYVTNDPAPSTLTISAAECMGSVLGNVLSLELQVAASGTYEKTIILTEHKLKMLSAGGYDSRYNWSCSQLGFIGSSYHKTYLLPTVPVVPWSLVKERTEQLVTVGALRFFAQTVDWKEKASNAADAGYIVHYLMDSERFTYAGDGKQKFTGLAGNENAVLFDQDRFDLAVSGTEKIAVGSLDCSAVIVNYCTLVGGTCNIVSIISNLGYSVIEVDGKAIQCLSPVFFEPVMPIGESDWITPERTEIHYVAERTDTEGAEAVYDGCMAGCGTDGKKIVADGIRFSDTESYAAGERDDTCYRETWFSEGTCCIMDMRYALKHGTAETVGTAGTKNAEKQEAGIVNSIAEQGGHICIDNNVRFPFDPLITAAMPVGAGQDRCHSISYSTLCNEIASPLEAYLQGQRTAAQVGNYLTGLRQIIFLNPPGGGVDARFRRGSVRSVSRITALLNGNTPAAIRAQAALRLRLIDLANALLNQMNNSLRNLRVGNASWNHSIQDGFDPVSWYYVNAQLQIICDETVLGYAQPPAPAPGLPPITAPGFYLTDADDGARLHGMLNDVYGVQGFCFFTSFQAVTHHGFVYSSSNQYAIPRTVQQQMACYYLHNNAWVQYQ